MKHINFYECEICHKRYDSEQEALNCESKGTADKSKLPIGLMYEYYHHGFVGIFAIATITNSYSGHFLNTAAWAMRISKYPQMNICRTDDICQGVDYISTNDKGLKQFAKCHHITKEKLNCPEFLKMKEFLIRHNIIPSYYDENGNLIKL